MRHDLFRKYLTNPRDFDGWLKANVLVGSIVAVAILTMALAALFSGGGSNQIELSSVGRVEPFALTRRHARGSLFDSGKAAGEATALQAARNRGTKGRLIRLRPA